MIAISLYMLGSLVCALAPNMFVLILGRVLHGLGGGGLTSTGMVVLGDIAAPKDRGKYYGYFSVTYTTAGACGPALGGAIAEYLHWSVIFWMNIPLGLIAMALTLTLLRRLPRHDRPHKLDFLGAALVMAASSSFMLALSMGGVNYPWLSAPILALFAAALVLGVAFIVRLRTAPEPLIPLSILDDREVRLSVAVNAFGWAPIVGLHIFLPIYLQNIVGMAPASAGLSVLMLAVTLNISAGITGTILPRREHYKTHPDRRPVARHRRGAGAGVARHQHDALGIRGAAVPDRLRLRLHAAARRHRAAEQRVDPHLRIGGRDHAVLAQPVRHHAGRGVRRAGADRHGRRSAARRPANIRSTASSACSSRSPRASRSRSSPIVLLRRKAAARPARLARRHAPVLRYPASRLKRRDGAAANDGAPRTARRERHGLQSQIAVRRIGRGAWRSALRSRPRQATRKRKYPDRPVKVVVGFTAGGGTDVAARVIAQKLSEAMGQTFVVENRAGASGLIASEQVAKSPADGYTIMVGSQTTLAVAPALYKKIQLDRPRSSPAWR